MPTIRTFLRWQDVDPQEMRDHTVVVIDVLRWTTVVVTALANGASAVEALATPEEALARAHSLGRQAVILGGERENIALPGFDLGNSPFEYTRERVAGKLVITTTTNGTQALQAAAAARLILIAAFVNLDAIVERLRIQAADGPVALICAGRSGTEALEDTRCAGAIAVRTAGSVVLDDVTGRATRLWQDCGAAADAAVLSAPHGLVLTQGGFGADVGYAGSVSIHSVVPSCSPAMSSRPLRLTAGRS